jgi:formylglycine-generating enzyme required for sulfatase activity
MAEMLAILPETLPPSWAEQYGEDEFGVFASALIEGVDFAFRWIPPGGFQMGDADSGLVHPVILTQGYWMLFTPVTQKQWVVVGGDNPSRFKGEERPVERVSWKDCQEWLEKLTGQFGDLVPRLPTEAEWEYACRGGTTTRYAFGNSLGSHQANFDGNYPDGANKGPNLQETSPVGQYEANPWGLYDMHGNVWEWCQDWYAKYERGLKRDPQGPKSGSDRVLRGGGWVNSARGCRSAFRGRGGPVNRFNGAGFRFLLQAGSRQGSPERDAVKGAPPGGEKTAET